MKELIKIKKLIRKLTPEQWEKEKKNYQSEDYSIATDGWNGTIYLYKNI